MTTNDRAAFIAAHDVSRETLARLDKVIDTLNEWRLKTNLIGPKEWPNIWLRHVWDSLQIVDDIPEAARVIDLGSGAGFPGLIISAARPDAHVTMIESTGKKCVFLREAILAADLNAAVHNGRVEAAPAMDADIITARAFAPLPKLLDYAAPWLKKGAMGLFHKGENWQEEVDIASDSWEFAYKATPSQSGGSGVILHIRDLESG